MKIKHLALTLAVSSLLLGATSLTSCGSKGPLTNSMLLISEVVEGSGTNQAVELYNMGDKDITLDDYSIGIYFNSESSPKVKVPLKGTIKPKETFIIANSGATSEIKGHNPLLDSKLIFGGNQPIALLKGSTIVDLVGDIGSNSSYNTNTTLVRKTNYFSSKNKWEEYDWIRYSCDNLKYLGNITNSVTPEEMEAGPRIDPKYFEQSFINENDDGLGGGGLVDVTLRSGVDGDTARFNYPSGYHFPDSKVRFQNINTPESYKENIQPWGIPAKFWTTEQLELAHDIKIQSLENGQLIDTYNRVLGWVWTDGELLNYKIVKNGYSEIHFGNVDNMFYKDISYTSWLKDAEVFARNSKKCSWGEKDPYWDYDKNQSTYHEKFDK